MLMQMIHFFLILNCIVLIIGDNQEEQRGNTTNELDMKSLVQTMTELVKTTSENVLLVNSLLQATPTACAKEITSAKYDDELRQFCENGNLDAATKIDGYTYGFRGRFVHKFMDSHGTMPGYPRLIQEFFPGSPSFIDAAFTLKDYTYLFKGCDYWKIEGMNVLPGYPQVIAELFSGIPCSLDAAFIYNVDNNLFFFKGSQYWKLEKSSDIFTAISGYPKSMSAWSGLPFNVDSAVEHFNGRMYIFKDDEYYRLDRTKPEVDEINENQPYPRKIADYWLDC